MTDGLVEVSSTTEPTISKTYTRYQATYALLVHAETVGNRKGVIAAIELLNAIIDGAA